VEAVQDVQRSGTGIRGQTSFSNVVAQIGGVPATIAYAGSQFQFEGLDQVNVYVPRSLAGAGEVAVVLGVACSAAFPLLFPPIRDDAQTLGANKRDFPYPQYLSDGGVYDNTGIRLPLAMISTDAMDLKFVLLSDAGKRSDMTDEPFVSP
jgi:hypothetical protein